MISSTQSSEQNDNQQVNTVLGNSWLRNADTGQCDCPPGMYEAWKTSQVRIKGAGTLLNVTIYSTNVDHVLFSSCGTVVLPYTVTFVEGQTYTPCAGDGSQGTTMGGSGGSSVK